MISRTTTTSATTVATTAATTYTTIPISLTDVISRSLHNFYTFLSRTRPWPDFLSFSSLDFPSSISTASSRFRLNSNHFSVNYSILLLTIIAATSLLTSPMSFLIMGLFFFLWLVFFFFREDPVFLFGRHVSDQSVLWGLILSSVVGVWYMGMLNCLLVGVSVGVLVCVVHGACKKTEGVFLDENDAVEDGLIVPKEGSSSQRNGGIH